MPDQTLCFFMVIDDAWTLNIRRTAPVVCPLNNWPSGFTGRRTAFRDGFRSDTGAGAKYLFFNTCALSAAESLLGGYQLLGTSGLETVSRTLFDMIYFAATGTSRICGIR
jgi:hypothetical protein